MKVPILATLFLLIVSGVSAQKDMAIAQVQGDGNTSPFVGQSVRLTGVVTARTKTGFFLQTPDDKADTSKNTSEGIFVELAIPADALETGDSGSWEQFRVNVRYIDYDRTEKEDDDHNDLWWRPDWVLRQDYHNSGVFIKR